MGSEFGRDVAADNNLSKERAAPLVQRGAPVFVTTVHLQTGKELLGADHGVPVLKNTPWVSNNSLLTSCELRFPEAANEARLWQVFFRLGIQAVSTYYTFAKCQFSDHK